MANKADIQPITAPIKAANTKAHVGDNIWKKLLPGNFKTT